MTPLPAASLLVVRDGPAGIEVIMGRRPSAAVFGGLWVFPGGKVDQGDRLAGYEAWDEGDLVWRLAALRETLEEVGVAFTEPAELEPIADHLHGSVVHDAIAAVGGRFAVEKLRLVSNWVTPDGVPARFDTRFYLVVAEGDVDPRPRHEFEESRWLSAAEALAGAEDGSIPMILPTRAHLEFLTGFPGVDDVVRSLEAMTSVPRIEPTMVVEDGSVVVTVGGDPRFETDGDRP